MAEARNGCMAIIWWIWTQVKRPFSYVSHNSPDSQVLVGMACVPAGTPGPSGSSHHVIPTPIQFESSPESQLLVEMDTTTSPPRLPAVVPSNQKTTVYNPASTSEASSSNDQIISQLDSHPSSSSTLPSSSTASRTRWKYDVFLSFRGLDTRKGITSEIRDRLQSRTIRTFMDDRDLEPGDPISPTLMKAIEESRFAVVVFSQNYASSPWCLEELAKIWKCMQKKKICECRAEENICDCMANEDRIRPLFFHVDITEVRYQQKGNFKQAFFKHETSGRYKPETVEKWRTALQGVAGISGWNTDDCKTHRELVDKIVVFFRSKIPLDAIESDDFQAYEATTKAMDEVKEALRDDQITVVGVYGMGGVGKTTMVTHVAAQACTNDTFNHWIIASISQCPDFTQIQDTLAELLGIDLKEKTEAGRAARLHKEIKGREKLLIILDDIWKGIKLSRIGIPSLKELQNCNSKVLLTTRIRNVCHAMECQTRITLNVLSEQDSWALFVRKARRDFKTPTFEDVAKKVARECRGLPIALITVARALGDKEDLREWRIAAQRLEKSQTANPDDYGEAFECIKLSYDFLKDKECKSFFLLCCLFPENRYIPIEDLLWYAIGKGLFRDAETLIEARGRAESLARHLQHSCLLLERKNESMTSVRLHDIVRDAAIQIAQSERGLLVKAGCGLRDWPRQLSEDCSAISLKSNHISKLPKILVCPKLQILLLNNNPSLKEIPETFFQSPNELRVFDLSLTSVSKLPENLVCPELQILLLNYNSSFKEIPETFFQSSNELKVFGLSHTSISLLPTSFSLLTNLQALYLDGCRHLVLDTSILGNLEKLEILSIRKLSLKHLSIELGGLTNLRIFDNTRGSIARISPKVISKWRNLEKLYIEGFRKWGRKMEGVGEETNAGFGEVLSLSKLKVLVATILDANCIPKDVDTIPNWDKVDISINGELASRWMPFSKPGCAIVWAISLKLDKLCRLPEWFRKEIMKRADRVSWEGCESLIDIVVEDEHGRLPGPKHLLISKRVRRTRAKVNPILPVPKKPVLEILEVLNLKSLDWAEFCAVVEVLPLGSLFNLKGLIVEDLYNRENILLPSTTLQRLPNLEKFYVRYAFKSEDMFGDDVLPMLQPLNGTEGVCEGRVPSTMFQNLQTLSVSECKFEGSLFTYDVARCLPQLIYFQLKRCPRLERIVEASNEKTILPKLKQLKLDRLPMLCYQSATFDIECPSLECFWVEDCPMFSVFASDFHSRKEVKLRRWDFYLC